MPLLFYVENLAHFFQRRTSHIISQEASSLDLSSQIVRSELRLRPQAERSIRKYWRHFHDRPIVRQYIDPSHTLSNHKTGDASRL